MRQHRIAHLAVAVVFFTSTAGAADYAFSARMREYEKRLDDLEKILERYYRGESLDDAHTRVNDLVDEFNEHIEMKNAELDRAKAVLDLQLAPVKKLGERIAVIDKQLKSVPDASNGAAVRRYNALVEERNRLVLRHNNLNKSAKRSVEVYNAQVKRTEAEIELARSRLQVEKAKVKARIDDFERLTGADTDIAFYTAINATLAQLLDEKRKRTSTSRRLENAIARVRAFRRELGKWATKQAEGRENGLVIVEARVGDEPFWFILDTGAMQTTISKEMVAALDMIDKIGVETKLVLAGGKKIKGNRFTFPEVSVAGRTEKDVTGVVVPVSEVGVDGLLGQSFLKRFVYTVDEDARIKLRLKPRPGR